MARNTDDLFPHADMRAFVERVTVLEDRIAGQAAILTELAGRLKSLEGSTKEDFKAVRESLGGQGRWEALRKDLAAMERRVQLGEDRVSKLETPDA